MVSCVSWHQIPHVLRDDLTGAALSDRWQHLQVFADELVVVNVRHQLWTRHSLADDVTAVENIFPEKECLL